MQRQSFNRGWRFHLGEAGNYWEALPDDPTWRVLDLPHDWSIELPRAADNPSGVSNGWFAMGRAWYRKTFIPNEAWRGQKVLVEFEGVYMNAEVWLNQHLLARHPYGYTPFTVDLTPYLQFGAPNILRVLVDNAAQLNSRWYSGSGIYRPVWLIVAQPVHLAQYGLYVTTPQVSAERAVVHLQAAVENESGQAQNVTLRASLFAPGGEKAAVASADLALDAGPRPAPQLVSLDFTLDQPQLWQLEAPRLYRLEAELWAEGRRLDSAATTLGIRSLEFTAEKGFLLNGQPLKLKGGCVHHDNGPLGSASYPRAEERKVEVLKASGFNAIRCAHNPPAEAMLEACDRLGMLVIDEAFDCWRVGKNPYDYHVVFEDWWARDLDAMLYRDRNHPSIILWSIGNEVFERDGRSGGVEIARQLAQRVRAVDPTRPVLSAICGVWDKHAVWTDTDGVFAQLDVGGYNYQWREYANDHTRHPQRMMVGTESFPLEAFDNWMAVLENSYVLGDFVWTSLDYLGESGIGRVHFGEKEGLGSYPWHQANCGDLDICGFKRPQSYYRDMVWGGGSLYMVVHMPLPEGKTPTISLWGWPEAWPNWNWPGREGETFKVEVYSACETVELFLNGHSLGTKPTGRAERLAAAFEVPYAPGELKAVGYRNGAPVAESRLETSGTPAALRLTPDRAAIGVDDLCYVTVEVVDAQGRLCPAAEARILFSLQGAGRLAAVGSGDPISTELYCGHERSVFHGRCLAIVKSEGSGAITLRAQADQLLPAELSIQAQQ